MAETEKKISIEAVLKRKNPDISEIITPDIICNLMIIYKYFGGRPNKLEKLFQEAGEFRDIWLLRDKTTVFYPEIIVEIADLLSVLLQLLLTEKGLQEELVKVLNRTVEKISRGYYENK